MNKLSFRNRIAFNYIISTGLLIFVVFCGIYLIVKFSVYSHINDDIKSEVNKHLTEIEITDNHIGLIHNEEWREREHNAVAVNPVFVQFYDKSGRLAEKSPNLKIHRLIFNPKVADYDFYDTKLVTKSIRQIQVPIFQNSIKKGYLLVAMSLEDSKMVLNNLSEILIISYPLILLLLFIIARLIAGRSIKPISSIIETSNIITKDNLKSRIPLPQNQDELYTLSQTINNLLDRVENTIEREKQFTSYASHELRTPLTIIKGTLEVLIRKPRNQEEYHEKINFCINEVNRLNHLVDQLLLLARFENQKKSVKIESTYLNAIILDTISQYSSIIKSKNIQITNNFAKDFYVKSDSYLLSIIINNLISNALKYSNEKGQISISIIENNGVIECSISDLGIGISSEDLQKIFDQFYRSKSIEYSKIKGTGLGLSIVKKLCEILSIETKISSQENTGTTVNLIFNNK
jgi:signal transduction histidine kinase